MANYFPILSCPPSIRRVADDFKDLLGVHYKAFTALLCGSIFGMSGLSTICRFVLFSPSVSSLSRFFDSPEMFKKLNRRHRRRVLRILEGLTGHSRRYLWAVDTTLISRWGKKIWGVYSWYDHTSQGHLFGHNLLVLGLVDRKRKVFIPVYWEILHREVEGQEHPHEKAWQVALKLIRSASEFGFPKFPVVMDQWFAGKDFFNELSQDGFSFVSEIKGDRNVVSRHGAKRNKKFHLADFFGDEKRIKLSTKGKTKWASEAILWFGKADQRLKSVAIFNGKDLVEEPFSFYVSNKLTWNASQIWALARDRWAIEVQFRELKQLFTLGEPAVRSQHAVQAAVCLSMIALTAIRSEQLSRADANENQYARPIPAGSIVRDHQLLSLTRSISRLALSAEQTTLKRLQTRLNRVNLNRKPAETRKTRLKPSQLPSWRNVA